tara:strand:- start:119 stop:463 length:345 start_codon:yes stop_codon:yes gene_type:complete
MKDSSKKNFTVLKIFRGKSSDKKEYCSYKVPYKNGASVLDALIWIRENLDDSLSFRYSCINANACKECMICVNGKTRYACTTRLTKDVTILEPLLNKDLICDLVTDIIPPKEKI